MNKILYTVIFLLAGSVVTGQTANTIQDGYQIFRYPNGTVSSEGLFKNGKPEGFWKSYYVTGIKKSEGKYSSFQLDSIWVFFDQAGDTVEKINYLFGKRNGYAYKFKKSASEGLYVHSKELYAGDKKEGTAFFYYPDGNIQQAISYNNGKKEGLSREFDKDGTVITLLTYNNDFLISRERINRKDSKNLKQGVWKEFYPNGGIKSEKNYRDDQLHGYYKEYDNRGILTLTMLYDNGSLVKSEVEDEPDIEIENRYDQNNKLIYSGPYRNKIPVGVHREYSADGKVTNSYVYNDNGLLISEGIVDESGRFNGKWKDLYPDGTTLAEGQYSDNRRTGVWKFYTASGKLEQTGSFNNGRPDGLWKSYYPDGKLRFKGNYVQGNPDGQLTYYYENGRPKEEQFYRMGIKQKTWKKYNEEGVPVLTITYKDDVEVSINGVKINLPESDVKLIK